MNAPFAGSLRTRLRFERPVHTEDRSGEQVLTWTPAFEAWGHVRSQTGKNEGVVAGDELAIASYDIELRHRTDITADMSVVLPGGTRLDILTEPVDPDGTRERTLLRCEYRGGAA